MTKEQKEIAIKEAAIREQKLQVKLGKPVETLAKIEEKFSNLVKDTNLDKGKEQKRLLVK